MQEGNQFYETCYTRTKRRNNPKNQRDIQDSEIHVFEHSVF